MLQCALLLRSVSLCGEREDCREVGAVPMISNKLACSVAVTTREALGRCVSVVAASVFLRTRRQT
jgi:hypothetical protein